MLDHLSIQCADLAASASFYDAVLAPLGGQRVMDFSEAIGYGAPPKPDFWIGRRATGDGFRDTHIAFSAPSRAARAGILRHRCGASREGSARTTAVAAIELTHRRPAGAAR